jgi:hypothetical protein
MRQLREETALAEDVKDTTAAREANFKWAGKPERELARRPIGEEVLSLLFAGHFLSGQWVSSRVDLRYGMRMKGCREKAQSFW